MKDPIALLINDIHVSKDNIDEFNKNWDEALSVCENFGIADIIVGGDMFTERASQSLATLLAVKHALDRAVSNNIYVTIAEGNHDLVNQEDVEGYNHLWVGLKGIDVIDTHKVLFWEGCDFALVVMSYFPENGSFLEKMETAVRDAIEKCYPTVSSKKDIILYIHEGVHGALGDFDIEGELEQEPLLGFKAVLCGHYHNRIKIRNTNIEYIGSSRQNNFGEDEEKGYTIIDFDGSYEFIKNQVNTRFKTFEIDADDDFSFEKDDRYKYKVKVKCTEKQANTFDKQKFLDMGFNKVEMLAETPVNKEVAASGIDEKYDKQGIKKEYQNYCHENDIDSELGLKYLED